MDDTRWRVEFKLMHDGRVGPYHVGPFTRAEAVVLLRQYRANGWREARLLYRAIDGILEPREDAEPKPAPKPVRKHRDRSRRKG